MSEHVDLFAGGRSCAAHDDHVDIHFWMMELMLCYKFGEKLRYKTAFDKLRPYMDDRLVDFFQEVYDNSTWTNPITGKKGY